MDSTGIDASTVAVQQQDSGSTAAIQLSFTMHSAH